MHRKVPRAARVDDEFQSQEGCRNDAKIVVAPRMKKPSVAEE
jgi:hypothetical protein